MIVSREPDSLYAFKIQSEVHVLISSRFLQKVSTTGIVMDFLRNTGMGRSELG
jgi:hypothetical protein